MWAHDLRALELRNAVAPPPCGDRWPTASLLLLKPPEFASPICTVGHLHCGPYLRPHTIRVRVLPHQPLGVILRFLCHYVCETELRHVSDCAACVKPGYDTSDKITRALVVDIGGDISAPAHDITARGDIMGSPVIAGNDDITAKRPVISPIGDITGTPLVISPTSDITGGRPVISLNSDITGGRPVFAIVLPARSPDSAGPPRRARQLSKSSTARHGS